jgi:predicted metalloendopeptidase
LAVARSCGRAAAASGRPWLCKRGRADSKIDGYAESRRSFLSFAQSSCENQTFLTARRSQSADPYSVGRVRVNGAVQNFEEFGKAFQCAKGKPMYPEKSCCVW